MQRGRLLPTYYKGPLGWFESQRSFFRSISTTGDKLPQRSIFCNGCEHVDCCLQYPVVEVVSYCMQRRIVLSASDIYDRSRALFQIPAKVFGGSPQILHLNYVHAQVGGRCDDSFKALVIVPGLREIVMDGEAGLELASCCLLLGKSDDLLLLPPLGQI